MDGYGRWVSWVREEKKQKRFGGGELKRTSSSSFLGKGGRESCVCRVFGASLSRRNSTINIFLCLISRSCSEARIFPHHRQPNQKKCTRINGWVFSSSNKNRKKTKQNKRRHSRDDLLGATRERRHRTFLCNLKQCGWSALSTIFFRFFPTNLKSFSNTC